MNTTSSSFFGNYRIIKYLTLGLILILGIGIRLYDLTDPPLDFHSTRQLWSAITARGMYYQGLEDATEWKRDLAVETWKSKPVIEPAIFESLTALTYKLIGQELLWIPRIFSSLFWTIGGVGLYLLTRDMTSVDGAITALAVYSFLPFGVIASRSFQPDPLMVMWIILSWWGFYRWHQERTWQNAILAGIFAGIAILIKNVAIFMILGGAIGLVFADRGVRRAVKEPQVWLVIVLSALPGLVYLVYGAIALEMTSQFEGRFFPELLTDPRHFIRWGNQIISITGYSGLIISLLGLFIFRERVQRAFVFGLWTGYLVYGLFFPYHFLTHDYYHLPLIPLVALCIAPAARSVFESIQSLKPKIHLIIGILLVFFLALFLQIWKVRISFDSEDFRHEPPYWEGIAEVVGRDKEVIALSQDYGYRLFYYGWLQTNNWPETGHLAYRELRGGKPFVFDEWFAEATLGMDYFLVTRLKELDRQEELRDRLYDGYSIAAQGDGYILFDLKKPLP